jgi:hypothetical protein
MEIPPSNNIKNVIIETENSIKFIDENQEQPIRFLVTKKFTKRNDETIQNEYTT